MIFIKSRIVEFVDYVAKTYEMNVTFNINRFNTKK